VLTIFSVIQDRLTVQEKEREEAKERVAEREAQAKAEQRRKETLRIVETMVKEDVIDRKTKDSDPLGLNEVNTDDENEEMDYEAWKLRELKRLKRDREEKENREREQAEAERLRNMTEDERRAELKNNPKIITNKAAKGKYKFLQKYYHRGAFFMESEVSILLQLSLNLTNV
jgi:microfibrillar-associated protein 1